MKKSIKVSKVFFYGLLVFVIIGAVFSCGKSNGNNNKSGDEKSHIKGNENKGGGGQSSTAQNDNKIQYLKQNHSSYSKSEENYETPVPIQNDTLKNIAWTIYAKSEENAIQLKEHIDFMSSKLTQGETPRPFDKLFLMEAYMKYNKKYTTITTRDVKIIKIIKQANTNCAYEVIKKHSDAVSGDFFANGNISKDYSLEAETILKSKSCEQEKSDIEEYINTYGKNKSSGMGKQKNKNKA